MSCDRIESNGMISKLKNRVNDVTIVSLSKGLLGEPFMAHEAEIGIKRLVSSFGVKVHFSDHAFMGIDYLEKHPECRAEDLVKALESDTDMILCAIGGDDTYRLLPYLFDNGRLEKCGKDKIFLGFSDTTMNHLMLHKVGINTFYGQAFLPDICELSDNMLPYTESYFRELIETGTISEITPSGLWYDSRDDFSESAIGTDMVAHGNNGFVLLQGRERFDGKILGGCIDSLYQIFCNDRHIDSVELCRKYGIFPPLEDWKGKILLLESSEEKAIPDKYRRMVTALKQTGIFDVVNGVLVGKPADEMFYDEYNVILKEVINNPNLPVVVNLNVGHSTPRCIIPFGVYALVDSSRQKIVFDS